MTFTGEAVYQMKSEGLVPFLPSQKDNSGRKGSMKAFKQGKNSRERAVKLE